MVNKDKRRIFLNWDDITGHVLTMRLILLYKNDKLYCTSRKDPFVDIPEVPHWSIFRPLIHERIHKQLILFSLFFLAQSDLYRKVCPSLFICMYVYPI